MLFVPSLEWEGFGLHMLRHISSWDKFCVLADMDWSIHLEINLLSSLAWEILLNTSWFISSLAWNGFDQELLRCILCPHCGEHKLRCSFVLVRMGLVWSLHVEMHFVSSLEWVGFGQLILRYILCPPWHGMCLVEAYFVSSLACGGFGQHMMRFILCPRWYWYEFGQHMLL